MGRSGGSRSSRSSGSRRSSGGFSGGRRSSGGFSSGRSSGRSSTRGSSYRSSSRSGYYGSHSRHYGGGYGRGLISSKFSSIILFLVVLLLTLAGNFLSESLNITMSTVRREKLPMSASQETSYFTDEAHWFTNIRQLESGLKSFYQDTGVQPHVYVTDGSHGTSIEELTALAEDTYDQICSDEAHFVLVFYDDGFGGYNCGYTVGSQARSIMDQEAISILNDYLDKYYYSDKDDISDEELFSKAFEKTGERIMHVTKSPIVVVGIFVAVVGGVVTVVFIGFTWWKKAKAAKLKEAELTAEILNTPLEKISDDKLDDLEKKYSDQ